MSKKMIDVTPFQYTYTIENIYTGEQFYTVNLGMVKYYAMKLMMTEKKDKYGRKLWPRLVSYDGSSYLDIIAESKRKTPHSWYEVKYHEYIGLDGKQKKTFVGYKLRRNVRPIVVYDNLGRIVSRSELAGVKMIQPQYNNTRFQRAQEMWDYKRNVTDSALCKRKGDTKKIKSNWATAETVDNLGNKDYDYSPYYSHSIRVKNEQTANEAHMTEYGEQFVRGRRAILPNAWDGKPSSFWGCRRSWKHNSKRRKQWKAK